MSRVAFDKLRLTNEIVRQAHYDNRLTFERDKAVVGKSGGTDGAFFYLLGGVAECGSVNLRSCKLRAARGK